MLRVPEKLTQPSKLIDNNDVFIFDCDGVIWRGDSVIEGVPDVLEHLRQLKKKIFFGRLLFDNCLLCPISSKHTLFM